MRQRLSTSPTFLPMNWVPLPRRLLEAGLQSNQEYLISLGVEEDIPHWRAMAAEAAPLL